jgi:hypothetical protein
LGACPPSCLIATYQPPDPHSWGRLRNWGTPPNPQQGRIPCCTLPNRRVGRANAQPTAALSRHSPGASSATLAAPPKGLGDTPHPEASLRPNPRSASGGHSLVMGEDEGDGGSSQTLVEGASPLCTPSMGSAGKAKLAHDTHTPSDSRREASHISFETLSLLLLRFLFCLGGSRFRRCRDVPQAATYVAHLT